MERKKGKNTENTLIKVAIVLFVLAASVGAIFLGKVLSDMYVRNINNKGDVVSVPLNTQ